MQRLLIIGASGMLGQELIDAARQRYRNGTQVVGTNSAKLDVRDRPTTEAFIHACRPDVVINCAARADVDGCEDDPEGCFAVNAAGAEHVALGCRGRARLIHVSTDYVFDGEKGEPYVETDTPNPINRYGQAKLEGEKRIEAVGGDFIAVRSALFFGRYRDNFVDRVRRNLQSGKPVFAVTDQLGSPTYTRDLAEAILSLIPIQYRGVVHVANGGHCSRFELAQEIARLVGSAAEIAATTWGALQARAARPRNSALSAPKLVELTGRPMRSWREALAEYVALRETA